MHHVVTLIAKRHGGTCTNQSMSRLFECYVSQVHGLIQNYNQAGGLTRSILSIPTG
ncbi:hypothetical protein Hanom_Chr03g00214071 [Helianthus anomalus]